MPLTAAASSSTQGYQSPRPLTLATLYTPKGARDILSEAVLLDEYGIEARKNPPRLTHVADDTQPDIPMTRRNGLFYVNVTFHASPSPVTVEFHVDGGSNCNFTCNPHVFRAATSQAMPGSIGGIAGGLQYTHINQNLAAFGGTPPEPG